MSGETIFALGTGAGRGAIAVIRLSGPLAAETLRALAGRVPAPRQATYVTLRDPASGEILDRGLALYFPAPASATGEDYAELHIHGGRATIEAILAALRALPGLRPAEAGEFARRAFAGGKLDLSQVEALADLIEAETTFQRRQALRVAGGALRRQAEAWRAAIIEAMALVEAELDFSDEGDVETLAPGRLTAMLAPIEASMEKALAAAPAAERLRQGFTVMILGRPNAGKSTLLNALAGRDMAIVSPTPGTTRDLIEAHLDIEGLPVTFIDTAGLREAEDDIERIGVSRVLERAEGADLGLWLSDRGEPPPADSAAGLEMLCVWTKADLSAPPRGGLAISAARGDGLEALLAEVGAHAKARMGDGGSATLIRASHREAVDAARAALQEARRETAPELAAEALRRAAGAVGRLTGQVDVEEVLDSIFSRFCMGK